MLALAAYVYVVAEMAPIGATPAIAAELGVSEARVGILTAAYAFAAVLATLPLVRRTARWPRRRVLVATLICLTVSQVLSALAPTFTALAASRLLCALTHGLLLAILVPIAARLVPETHTGRATTAIYAGTAGALVLGNPMTTALSEAWGWRPAVAVLAVAAAAATVLARCVLPPMPTFGTEPAALTRKPLALRNNRLLVLCALTLVGVTAHFVSFTYVVPIIRDVAGVAGARESWVLIGFGAVGLLTLASLGRALDRRVRAAAAGAATVLCVAFGCLSALAGGAGHNLVAGVAAILVWGAAAALLPPLLQSAAIRTAPGESEQASAVYVTVFQVGIMTGSLTGGIAYAHNGIGTVVTVSAALFAVALAGVLLRGDVFAAQSHAKSGCAA